MEENDIHRQVKTLGNDEDLENKVVDTTTNNAIKETKDNEDKQQAKRRAKAKKGFSVTRALLIFGHESWITFEPGKYKPYYQCPI